MYTSRHQCSAFSQCNVMCLLVKLMLEQCEFSLIRADEGSICGGYVHDFFGKEVRLTVDTRRKIY